MRIVRNNFEIAQLTIFARILLRENKFQKWSQKQSSSNRLRRRTRKGLSHTIFSSFFFLVMINIDTSIEAHKEANRLIVLNKKKVMLFKYISLSSQYRGSLVYWSYYGSILRLPVMKFENCIPKILNRTRKLCVPYFYRCVRKFKQFEFNSIKPINCVFFNHQNDVFK